eukprot:TRINITY_DN8897_c0_g1_i2.p1 TRINITY_DN8897_c0_g1~~TRINITY_DN8897_c0_g1_i2.p1  ORF type:complete len:121 (+),score=3.95 TRINITY_DN8897_c0_g1_i2:160-522(+)
MAVLFLLIIIAEPPVALECTEIASAHYILLLTKTKVTVYRLAKTSEFTLERVCGIRLNKANMHFTAGRIVQSVEESDVACDIKLEANVVKPDISLNEIILAVYLADSKGLLHEYKIKDFC